MIARLPDREALLAAGFSGLRVVGDVHGEARPFAHAIAGAREAGLFVIQLGDLTDHGADSPAALRLMCGLLDEGRGLFLLGNHDHKLRRALLGHAVTMEADGLARTLADIDAALDADALRARAIAEITQAPAWFRLGTQGFVHGAWHPAMAHEPPPENFGARKMDGLMARALFGELSGRQRADGAPERLIGWVDRLPQGFRVWCGHDRRSTDGRPYTHAGRGGGSAVFLDTGAGKGGPLAWVDVPL